ncbi:MFS transporter [Paenibacillus sp. CGMCC 1.16610]|uniref:MFS transporter n=1 Tax=Paenibacillus anseongense TaxID=2682845 RepID=A0ABW9U5N8_9BACL|nr:MULTISPECIES: MFS transporter [Paenibacillus]MBA2942476.1 MFS transporter [Paenibacillus sp. CGMCC 1.16610]MVQ34550.1 MFS transporter [Paenibacillus anseongense]
MTFFQFHPNVRLRIALSFLTNILSNMVIPFMSIYFARTLGTTIAGTATTISIAVALISATIGGHYADRVGRKKMMLIGEGVALLAYTIMTFANSPIWHSAALTLIMTVISTASWGLSKPAVEAMLIDVSGPDTRKAIYRINYWSNNLAISVAGMIGGFFFSDYLFELLFVASGMSLVALLVTAFFMTETMPAEVTSGEEEAHPSKRISMYHRYKEVLSDRRFLIYLISSVLIVSVEMNLNGYIGIRLAQDIHHTPWFPGMSATIDGLPLVGVLRTENTLAVVLLSLFVGRLLKGNSDTRMMLFAMFLNVAGYTYLVFGSQPIMLMLLMLVATIGELTYVPIKQALLVQLVPDHARSSYMALSSMTNRVAIMLSGLNMIIGGFLPSGAMALFILLTGVAGIGLMATILPSLKEAEQKVHHAAV